MRDDCALYRSEKVGDDDYYYIREYCDGLEETLCDFRVCPFFKSSEKWKAIVVRKQTRYVRREE